MTAGKEDGIGAYLSMKAALRDSHIDYSDVQYVNAHATSTTIGDAIENRAIKKCFGDHAHNLKISSFKGSLGHLLGAAGAVETALTLLAIKNNIIPPTMNLDELDPEFEFDYVPNEAISFELPKDKHKRIAIKNSFGFGGTNASLCLGAVSYTHLTLPTILLV